METEVYANDREICSAAADGQCTAFPDTCYSPGAPYPGVPTPYPNTAKAADLANGSTTVFICGSPVCLRDESYLGTSTGDDPATQGLGKGVITGVIKGKAYFITWSPDVKAEGYNVTRHLDSITHNHGSSPPNTPPTKFMDTPGARVPCAADLARIEKKCAPEPEEPAKKAPKKGLKKFVSKATEALDNAGKTLAAYKRKPGGTATRGNAWMDDHCDGLWVTPSETLTPDVSGAIDKAMKTLESDKWSLLKAGLDELGEIAIEKAGDAAKRKVRNLLIRSGLKGVVGLLGVETGIVTAAMAAWTVTDVLSTAAELAELAGPEGLAMLQNLTDISDIGDKAEQILKDIKDHPTKAMANAMELFARFNACIRARKCMLVPYKNTKGSPTKAMAQARHGHGCCPGQTGHHVLPGAMFEGTSCGYDHNDAPVICLEGTSNHAGWGSHGEAHTKLHESMTEYNRRNGDKISYPEAKKQAVDAIEKAGAKHCDRKCLEAQLDAFYENCKNEQLRAVSGKGGGQGASTSDTAATD